MSDILGKPNEKETSTTLNIESCLTTATISSKSAIDEYEETSKKFIILAATADSNNDKLQIRLLVLGLVSSCEYYFRRILSEAVAICPISNASCAKHDIKYSAATYFSKNNIGLALTDDSVFSGANNIIAETKRLTCLSVNDSDSLSAALSEYQKVCVIRHATVHSYGFIGGKNFLDLSLKTMGRYEVALTYDSFQEIAGVCLNLVRAYNGQMWTSIISRLITKEFLLLDSSIADIELFSNLVNIFWSNSELTKFPNTTSIYNTIINNRKSSADNPQKTNK